MRVLSLTCSTTGYERNWSTFEQVHSKKNNCLEQQMLNDVVYVKYNLHLDLRQKVRENGENDIRYGILNTMMNALRKGGSLLARG